MTVWAYGFFNLDYGSAFDGRQKHGIYSAIWSWSTKTTRRCAPPGRLRLLKPIQRCF
jgi:hypothetical protein